MEREADQFAAALLIPVAFVEDLVYRRRFLTLTDLLKVARECEASATCAVIRYVELVSSPCAVVVSKSGKCCFYIASEDAQYRGFKWLGSRTVARDSCTARANRNPGANEVFEGESHTELWFSDRRGSVKLWEEAFPLGYTGLVLTLLAFEVPDDD